MTSDLFKIGSRWRHKRQRETLVFIKNRSEVEGHFVFRLGCIPTANQPRDIDTAFSATSISVWTAEELILEFEPVFGDHRPSALERVLYWTVIDDED